MQRELQLRRWGCCELEIIKDKCRNLFGTASREWWFCRGDGVRCTPKASGSPGFDRVRRREFGYRSAKRVTERFFGESLQPL